MDSTAGKMRMMIAAAAAAMLVCVAAGGFAAEKSNRPPVSPAWVFDHWVWEDDDNTQAAVMEMVDGYAAHGIPVGAVVIDSPWATEYNNFIWNRKQYPDPEGMIKELHGRGIKVILWVTAMINEKSPGGEFEPTTNEVFKEAKSKGYLCNGGKTYKWWKGEGAFVDYTNPEAVKWWHGLMDRVIDMGADGWKVDGVDPMFPSSGFCKSGPMDSKKYKDLYYMDMHDYLVSKNPQGASWSRAVDILLVNPKGFAPISHSSVNWVGDQVHDWSDEGFLEALRSIFDSAKLGYTVVGSDTAGYHGDMAVSKEILIRWSQFSTFTPLFENGGHGAHEPWLHDEETVEIYRRFVKLHLELKPYFYSMMMKGHEQKQPIMHVDKKTWQFVLGDNLFVSVLHKPGNRREVTFPAGKWRDYWEPEKVFSKGESVNYDVPISRYPVFVREGSIVPLYVKDSELGHGDAAFDGRVTLDVVPGADSVFKLYEEGRQPVDISLKTGQGGSFDVSATDGTRPFIVRALSFSEPKAVIVGGASATKAGSLAELAAKPGSYFYDAAASRLYANPGADKKMIVSVTY